MTKLRLSACLAAGLLVTACTAHQPGRFAGPVQGTATPISANSGIGAGRIRTSAQALQVRNRLLTLMLVRAGVLAACGRRSYARRAIWNALITNRLPPRGGHWTFRRIKSALGRSIQYSVRQRNIGRLRCRSGMVYKMARDTNAIYVLLRRRYPQIPSAEAIARGGPRKPAGTSTRRRLSNLFDVPSRGVQGF